MGKFTTASSLLALLSGGGNISDANFVTAFQLPTTTSHANSSPLKAGLRDLTDPYFDNSNNGGGDYYPDYGGRYP